MLIKLKTETKKRRFFRETENFGTWK